LARQSQRVGLARKILTTMMLVISAIIGGAWLEEEDVCMVGPVSNHHLDGKQKDGGT
jgi:hypothetical protein